MEEKVRVKDGCLFMQLKSQIVPLAVQIKNIFSLIGPWQHSHRVAQLNTKSPVFLTDSGNGNQLLVYNHIV